MDLVTLMESVHLNPTDPKKHHPGGPKKTNPRALRDIPSQQQSLADNLNTPSQPQDHKIPATSLLPLATSVLSSPTTSETSNNSSSLTPQVTSTRKVTDKPSQSTKSTTPDHKKDPPKHEQASTTSSSVLTLPPTEPAPQVVVHKERSSSTSNDYIWHTPIEVYELTNKLPETPWAYFIGDSMFKYINPTSIVSRGVISKKFHPHAEAVVWERNHLAPGIAKYNKYSHDGPGLDILIISVGTNDVSHIQKLGGIAPHIDVDKLVQSRISQLSITSSTCTRGSLPVWMHMARHS